VVTHSGFTRSLLLAAGREPYRPQNAELVPVVVDRLRRLGSGEGEDDEDDEDGGGAPGADPEGPGADDGDEDDDAEAGDDGDVSQRVAVRALCFVGS
jgi:hypothetical protein